MIRFLLYSLLKGYNSLTLGYCFISSTVTKLQAFFKIN